MNEAIAALLARPRGKHAAVLTASSAGSRFEAPGAQVVPDRELAKTLRERKRPALVVAITKLNPTLVRALRDAPPTILALCGPLDDDKLGQLDGLGGEEPTLILGPGARLRCGDGPHVLCAPGADELERLCDAIGPLRLALSPTPAWLADALQAEPLKACTAVGYVPWDALHLGWVEVAREDRHVLVPLGVTPAPLDRPRAPELDQAAAAHALERLTGPVYPAPRVLAAIARGLADPEAQSEPLTAPELALWQQARRALPSVGATLGMEAPDPSTPATVPTAAFVAQSALVFSRRARELLATPELDLPQADEDRVERALEVLSASGEVLSEHESKVVLRGFGLEITRQAVANSASGAAQYAERIGFPVVLKAVSPDLRRKTEVGGVKLGLNNAAAVRRSYAAIVSNVEENAPTARLDGVAVAEMVPPGVEVQCGAVRLADGGVALYGRPLNLPAPVDAVLGVHPLDPPDALLLAHAVLSRVGTPALRRASDPDPRVLAGVFLELGALLEATGPRILSVDLNPIRLLDDERPYVVLDARIVQRAHLEGA